jgi:hypothetical protein
MDVVDFLSTEGRIMGVLEFGIATAGVILTPLVQGALLAILLRMARIVSIGANFNYRSDLWIRSASHLVAATWGARGSWYVMRYFGYEAGWIWVFIVCLYFIQNYYFRRSRGTLQEDSAFLLIFDVLGIFLGYALLRS